MGVGKARKGGKTNENAGNIRVVSNWINENFEPI